MPDIEEIEDEDFWEDPEDFEDFDEPGDIELSPNRDYERIELLRIALNFPKRPGSAHAYECCTPSDLQELEDILKKHYRS